MQVSGALVRPASGEALMARLQRRQLLLARLAWRFCHPARPGRERPRGGGRRRLWRRHGGALPARLAPRVQVTLVEPAERFVTCPFSNHYLAGLRSWDSISHGYDGLRAAGVQVIHARAEDVDGQRRSLRLHTGQELPWDRLVLSPGVDMRWGALEGYDEAAAELAPHAGRPAPRPGCCAASLRPCPTAACS